jgi:hypothetical protein
MLTCVRWYVASPLSPRHFEEMMQTDKHFSRLKASITPLIAPRKNLRGSRYSAMPGRAIAKTRLTTGSFAVDRAGLPRCDSKSPLQPFIN